MKRTTAAEGTIATMAALWRAYVRAIESIEAVYNQPRTTDEAREQLEHHMDQFGRLSDGLIAKLKLLDAPNEDEGEERSEILLLHAIRCGYGRDEIAAIAAEAARARKRAA
jgi:hypothetical protein